jgi:hypothetical protein
VKCAQCNGEHELLDPTFRRPDVVFRLPLDEQDKRVLQSNDLCSLEPAATEARRHFVRCTLPLQVTDVPDTTRWGLWAEIAEKDATRVLELWDSVAQNQEPPFRANIANHIPGYPETLGLPVQMRLTGPTTRPELAFGTDVEHPLALECRSGVTVHKVMEWLKAMGQQD